MSYSKIVLFGDSKGVGSSASPGTGGTPTTPAGVATSPNGYANLIATAESLSIVNYSVGGNEMMEQATNIYANSPDQSSKVMIALGANDEKTKISGEQLKVVREQYIAALAWHMPAARVTKADDASVIKTGTWISSPGSIFPFSRVSQVAGSRLLFSDVIGEDIVVTMLVTDLSVYPTTSAYDIYVDGIFRGSYTANAGSAIASGQGQLIAARGILIAGLGHGPHQVEVVCTATGLGMECAFVAGLDRSLAASAIPVRVFNSSRQTSAGYAANGGSDAQVAALNAVIDGAARTFSSRGFPVRLIDVWSVINPSTDISTVDGIHENNAGHAKWAAAAA